MKMLRVSFALVCAVFFSTLAIYWFIMVVLYIVQSLHANTTTVAPSYTGIQPKNIVYTMLQRMGLESEQERSTSYVGVVIENHPQARPHQTALQKAYLVQEWPVEGLATRFMAIFDTDDLSDVFGPIRSLRPYLIDGAEPWTNIYFHAGASPEAYNKLALNKDLTNINGTGNAYAGYFFRDTDIAEPHNLFIQKDDLVAVLQTVSGSVHTMTGNQSTVLTNSSATTIDITNVSATYKSTFVYEPNQNVYIRTNGNSTTLFTPAHILVLEMPIQSIGEKGRLSLNTIGSGSGALFTNGSQTYGTWTRSTSSVPWQFIDTAGTIVDIPWKHTWMSVVPDMKWLQVKAPNNS